MKSYKDWLSRLPVDIQIRVFSYSNPYKENFTRLILQNDTLWKTAWIRYYDKHENLYEKLVIRYILGSNGILKKTENFVYNDIDINSHSFYTYCKEIEQWIETTYPSDIYFEIQQKDENIFVTIYKEEPIEGGGYCGILGSSIIIFHCIITEGQKSLSKNYYGYNLYTYSGNLFNYVYGNNEYKMYKYPGFGRPA